MSATNHTAPGDSSRRSFLKRSSIGLAGAAAAAQVPLVHAGSGPGARVSEIQIGVIGCGGRGTGAALDALGAATKVIYPSEGYHTEDVAQGAKVEHKNIKVVALADLFEDRLDKSRASSPSWASRSPAAAASPGSTPTSNCSRPPRSTT